MSPIKIKTETLTNVTVNNINIEEVIDEARKFAHTVLEELSIYRQQNNLDSDTFSCEADACAFLDLIGDQNMIKPDKELWDKVGFNTEKYEYVSLPSEVSKILKRKKGNDVLLSYYYYDKDEKVMMLHYTSYDGRCLCAKGGYCSHQIDNPNQWRIMAESIAQDWPQYAIKKRNKTK